MGEGLQRAFNAARLTRALDGTHHPAKYMKCSKRQLETFEQIAVGQDKYLNPKVVDKLVAKGLVVRLPDRMIGRDVFGPIMVRQYEVPIPVHMAWCSWCSKQPEVIAEAERE